MIVLNMWTSRIIGVDGIVFLPSENKNGVLQPSKTVLTEEQFKACMDDRSTRKFFASELKGRYLSYTEGEDPEAKAPEQVGLTHANSAPQPVKRGTAEQAAGRKPKKGAPPPDSPPDLETVG